MRSTVFLAAILAAVLTLGACGTKEKNNPTDVVKKYIKSARDGDAEGIFETSYFIFDKYNEEFRKKEYERRKKDGYIDKMLNSGFKNCGDIDTYEIDSVGEIEDYNGLFCKDYKSRKIIVTANTLEDSRKMTFTLVLDKAGYWVVRELSYNY